MKSWVYTFIKSKVKTFQLFFPIHAPIKLRIIIYFIILIHQLFVIRIQITSSLFSFRQHFSFFDFIKTFDIFIRIAPFKEENNIFSIFCYNSIYIFHYRPRFFSFLFDFHPILLILLTRKFASINQSTHRSHKKETKCNYKTN